MEEAQLSLIFSSCSSPYFSTPLLLTMRGSVGLEEAKSSCKREGNCIVCVREGAVEREERRPGIPAIPRTCSSLPPSVVALCSVVRRPSRDEEGGIDLSDSHGGALLPRGPPFHHPWRSVRSGRGGDGDEVQLDGEEAELDGRTTGWRRPRTERAGTGAAAERIGFGWSLASLLLDPFFLFSSSQYPCETWPNLLTGNETRQPASPCVPGGVRGYPARRPWTCSNYTSIDIVVGPPPEESLFLILTSTHLLNKVRI
jgi:hypothetical protein